MNSRNQWRHGYGWLLLLAGWLVASEALALNFRGVLGAAANAQARYLLTCYPQDGHATQRVSFSINGLSKNPRHQSRLTVEKDGDSEATSDPANGDRQPGLPNSLWAGDGAYFLTIGKAPAARGKMAFEVDIECMSAGGYPTGATQTVKLTAIASGITGFSGALKKSPEAQAKYLVACYPEGGRITGRFGFRVRAVTRKRDFGVNLLVKKDGGLEEAVDFTPGDEEFSDDWSYLEEGDGLYELTLTKPPEEGPARGTMVFKVENRCEAEDPPALSGISAPIKW